MEFKSEVTEVDSATLRISLVGYFDEFSLLPENVDFDKYSTLEIDFNKLDFLNSGGIKLWLHYVDTLNSFENLHVKLLNCPQMVVGQVNLISDFLPHKSEVVSVYVPVFCDKCSETFNVLQEVDNFDGDEQKILDRVQPDDCTEFPACKSEHELDVILEQYFEFKSQNKPSSS